jgi:hypothetical protein
MDFLPAGTTGHRLRVRDFNPFATLADEPAGDASLEDWRKGRIVREPLCIAAGPFFAKDVESHLPYREVITEELFDLTEVMIDDNQIVLKKVMLFWVVLISSQLTSTSTISVVLETRVTSLC